MTVQEVIQAIRLDGLTIDGSVKRIKQFVNGLAEATELLEEVEQYRALATVEELKEAREKQILMKIKEIHVDEYYCPACGSELNCNDAKVQDKYCSECGQRFEVSEEDD